MNSMVDINRMHEYANVTANGVTVRVFQGLDGLASLENDWTEISRHIAAGSHIHTIFWYRSYLQHLENERDSVYFFLILKDEKPLAVIPLLLTNREIFGRQLRVWMLAARDQMDISDIIVHSEAADVDLFACLRKVLNSFQDEPWDCLLLQNTLEDSLAVSSISRKRPQRCLSFEAGASRYLSCRPEQVNVYENLKGRFRRNLRRCNNKLGKMGTLSFEQFTDATQMPEAFEQFLEVEASGWKSHEARGRAIATEERLVGFFRQLSEDFSARDQCMINLLSLDGKVIAGQLCLFVNNRIYILKIGFDEDYRNVSAGYVLLGRLVDHCYEHNIDEISFITNGRWTDDWQALSRTTFNHYIFNATAGGMSGYMAASLVRMRQGLGGLLPESLKNRIRSLLGK